MAGNEYHFVTRWRLPGPVEEISEVIGDAEGLTRWWPAVYLEVTVLESGSGEATIPPPPGPTPSAWPAWLRHIVKR